MLCNGRVVSVNSVDSFAWPKTTFNPFAVFIPGNLGVRHVVDLIPVAKQPSKHVIDIGVVIVAGENFFVFVILCRDPLEASIELSYGVDW